jgi:hypothetical protein
MGGGNWSDAAYTTSVNKAKSAGVDKFAFNSQVHSGSVAKGSHEKLDPKKFKNGIREARDSVEHPNSKPVFVGLDVTGSMASVPRMIQGKLPTLMGLLVRKGYLADPAICVSAIGDVLCDAVPLQVGQFESGIEIDDDISNIYMEGAGGGNMHESYDLALYFLARCVKSDAWEKRQQKGYAFIICDEELRAKLSKSHVEQVFGSTMGLENDIDVVDLMAEVLERWELYVIIPKMTAHYDDPSYSKRWRELLNERVLMLDDPNGISELIASTIGILEENTDMDSLVADLTSAGVDDNTAASVSRALATVGNGERGISQLSKAPGLTSL